MYFLQLIVRLLNYSLNCLFSIEGHIHFIIHCFVDHKCLYVQLTELVKNVLIHPNYVSSRDDVANVAVVEVKTIFYLNLFILS